MKKMIAPEYQEALAKIKVLHYTLRPAEKRIADLILADPGRITTMTISDVAKIGECSETTVIRMAKALGYRGFGELKMAIARELPRQETNLYEAIKPDDSLPKIAGSYFYHCVQSFNDTLNLLEEQSLEKAVDILSRSRRVGCFGSGASGLVANDAEQKLLRVQISTWAFVDPHEQLTFANGLTEADAIVCISHSGATKDVLDSMAVARENGAKVIGIVGNPRSKLAEAADVYLLAASSEPAFKSGSMISRLCQLAVVDLLTLGIAMNRKETILEQFSRTQETVSHRSIKTENER